MNKRQFGLITRETRKFAFRVSSLAIMNYQDVWLDLVSPTSKRNIAGYAFTKVAIQCVNKFWPNVSDINDFGFDQTDAVSAICTHLVKVCSPAYITKMFPTKPSTDREVSELNSFLFYVGTNVLKRYYTKNKSILDSEEREADVKHQADDEGNAVDETPLDTYPVSEIFQADYELLLEDEINRAITSNKKNISRRIKNKNKKLKKFYEDVYRLRVFKQTGKLPTRIPILALSTGAHPTFVKASVDIITYIESFIQDLSEEVPLVDGPSLLFPIGLNQDFEILVFYKEDGECYVNLTKLEEDPILPNQ